MGKSNQKVTTLEGSEARFQERARKAISTLVTCRQMEGILNEETFHTMLTFERRRADRSRKPFATNVARLPCNSQKWKPAAFLNHDSPVAMSEATRETDITGWYEEGAILAVIFTEINVDGGEPDYRSAALQSCVALQENLEPKSHRNWRSQFMFSRRVGTRTGLIE